MSSHSGSEDVEVKYVSSMLSHSSSDVPMDEWSSLMEEPEIKNEKMALYKKGLYDPGSGEICTKYITMSDSSVLRHKYYQYPSVRDPGIVEALKYPEERKIYPVDGQERYLDVCKEMQIIPVRPFYRGLLEESIDLKYYGVNPTGVRAMSMALLYNGTVRRLDLSSNFLDEDACYHLGQMLGENVALQELILSGCRIGAEGMRRLAVFLSTRTLETLDLSKNELGDAGFEHLAYQLSRKAVIKRLNLSYNDLGGPSLAAFAEAIERNKTIVYLDLSWNKLSSIKDMNDFLNQLCESQVLVELNLSWNSLKISTVLKRFLKMKTLKVLDLSNNKLTQPAVAAIASSLAAAKGLRILDLSFNPLTPQDAMTLLNKMKLASVKLTNLLLNNITVTKSFIAECQNVLALKFRKDCVITYGEVYHDYTLSVANMKDIIFKRLDYVTSKASKKRKLDVGVYFLGKIKTCDYLMPKDMTREWKAGGIVVDEDLVTALVESFPGPKFDKLGQALDLIGVVDYVRRLWPDKKAPPTPPPEEVPPKTTVPNKKKK